MSDEDDVKKVWSSMTPRAKGTLVYTAIGWGIITIGIALEWGSGAFLMWIGGTILVSAMTVP